MTRTYIGLGSNLDGPHRQLQAAVRGLAEIPSSRVEQVSGIYRSRAVGPGDQPDYLNAVASLETALPEHRLLDHLQAIEQRQGRVRSVRWGPRTLDLDILLYGDQHLQDARLTIPHPRLMERNFVLVPLAEICDAKMLLPDGTELVTLLATCSRDHLTRTDLPLTLADASAQ